MNLKKSILSGSIALLALAGLAKAAPTFVPVAANITTNTRWTRDNVYILRDIIYVLPGATLTIEPGTIIRGVKEGSGFDTASTFSPGSLIVTRGGKLIANGTPDEPIIFTSIDDINVPGGASTRPTTVNGNTVPTRNYAPDGPGGAAGTGDNGFAYDGEWGGLALLGLAPIGYDADGDETDLTYNAGTNTYSGDAIRYPVGASPLPSGNDIKGGDGTGISLLEGLSAVSTIPVVGFTEPFPGAENAPASGNIIPGVYGGLNRADNSGSIQFVVSRYGGFKIGDANELNGITFGGTGSGTTCEWLEAFNNTDDSFEFFGGYTNFRFMFSLFQDDDGFDGDQGYNGNMQFLFGITDSYTIARSGYPSNNTTVGRTAGDDGQSDNLAEWDGSEALVQGSILPNTEPFMYNGTFIGSPAVTGKDGLRIRRGGLGTWKNMLWQDVPDDAYRVDADPGTALTTSFNVYASVGDKRLGANAYDSTIPTALATEVVGKAHLTKNGLDPRLASGAAAAVPTNFNVPANRTGDYPFTGWMKVPFAGAMRDNNMLAGWTTAEYLDLLPTTNIARPEIALGKSGSNSTVNFAAATGVGGRAVLYAVERSTNRRAWTTFAIVSDGNAAGTTDFSGTTFATTDGNGTAGQIAVTDTVAPITAGTPVYYRVIPL
jgi:hypothetical protein